MKHPRNGFATEVGTKKQESTNKKSSASVVTTECLLVFLYEELLLNMENHSVQGTMLQNDGYNTLSCFLTVFMKRKTYSTYKH
jgi:hypothetical protein